MLNVLVADDDANVREILATVLRSRGFTVDLVKNGLDAVREYAAREYHVVVTDLRMPKMDGLEVAEAVRRINPDACVVMMTADVLTAGLRSQIDALGIDG